MARRPAKKRINDLLAPYSERFRTAFQQSIQGVRDSAEYSRIVAALAAGDIDAAVRALHIDPGVFTAVDLALMEVFHAGGTQAAGSVSELLKSSGTVIRFQGRNNPAEDWLSQYSGELIQALTSDQLLMVRNHMQAGLAAGQGPQSIALDLVGRLDRRTGKRAGGVVGLTDYQAQLVRNARSQLVGGSTAELREYLKRDLRDKRFDTAVLKAIKSGKPLPVETADRMIRSYESSMLRLRGETISRTEVMKSLHAAQHFALRQTLDAGFQPQQVRRVWRTASDKDVRDTHSDMEGQSVGLDEPFITGGGVALMYPGDPAGPASEVINCRCDVEVRIDFLSNLSGT